MRRKSALAPLVFLACLLLYVSPKQNLLARPPQSDKTVLRERLTLTGRVLARVEPLTGYRVNLMDGRRYDIFVFGAENLERAGNPPVPVKVVYEFYQYEPSLAERFFNYSSPYELSVYREATCDETVRSLSYESLSESGKPPVPRYALRVLSGASIGTLKPDLKLTCFVLRPWQYAPHNTGKQETKAPSMPQVNSDAIEHTTFLLRIVSDGILCPINNRDCEDKNIWWKNFALLASNGHSVDLTSIPFPSADRTQEQFDLSIDGADQILRRSPVTNRQGDQEGERALGLFPGNKETKPPSGVPHYKLFWTYRSDYWEITGEYLDDVLALEKRLKEQGTNAVWGWR